MPNSHLAHDIVLMSMRRNDVASTLFRRHVPTRFLINQCQKITFLILKSDIIENSSMELKGIVLPVPSNQIKVTLFYSSTWYICDFCLFHIEIGGKCGWIIRGGQRACCPNSQIIGGDSPCPPPPPSSYAYALAGEIIYVEEKFRLSYIT